MPSVVVEEYKEARILYGYGRLSGRAIAKGIVIGHKGLRLLVRTMARKDIERLRRVLLQLYESRKDWRDRITC